MPELTFASRITLKVNYKNSTCLLSELRSRERSDALELNLDYAEDEHHLRAPLPDFDRGRRSSSSQSHPMMKSCLEVHSIWGAKGKSARMELEFWKPSNCGYRAVSSLAGSCFRFGHCVRNLACTTGYFCHADQYLVREELLPCIREDKITRSTIWQ